MGAKVGHHISPHQRPGVFPHLKFATHSWLSLVAQSHTGIRHTTDAYATTTSLDWTRNPHAIQPSSSPYPVWWATLRAPLSWWPEETFQWQNEVNSEMLSHTPRTAWGSRLRPADLAWHLRFRPGDLPRRIRECGRESSCPTSSTGHRHLVWLPLFGLQQVLCVGHRPVQPSPYPQRMTTTSVAGRRRRVSTDYRKQASKHALKILLLNYLLIALHICRLRHCHFLILLLFPTITTTNNWILQFSWSFDWLQNFWRNCWNNQS